MKRRVTAFACLLLLVIVSACAANGGKLQENTVTCSIRVTCSEALKKADMLKDNKEKILPKDGVMLDLKEVEVNKGEMALSVLIRELQKEKIHYECETVTGTDIEYIRAVGNLYEFDCGKMSGWIYTVNGKSPEYSASAYEVKDGDVIEWKYITEFDAEA